MLKVALDTLASEGVAGFTTRTIAAEASTSTPAVYELFGDKAGLVREVFFEGFRMLRRHYEKLKPTDDPIEDLVTITRLYRRFASQHPELVRVMFSRPFADFDPTPDEAKAGADVRELIVDFVRRAVDAGLLEGDPTDIAHALLALILGLADAEAASRLGRSKASVNRRWNDSVRALLRGYAPRRR